MSEYQYYEFQAIDLPLSRADQKALRAISSRARITAASLTNTYEWGDFKGDPDKLMERWFDLHLHLTNWGFRRLMVRLPQVRVDRAAIDRFLGKAEGVRFWAAGGHLILDITREEVGLDEEMSEESDSGAGWLGVLGTLRAEVIAGDLRLFHLLWLTAVEAGAIKDNAPEPLPGIRPLTGALAAFGDFFGIDPDLIQAAAESSPNGKRTAEGLRARARIIGRERERVLAEEAAAERRSREQEAEKALRKRIDEVRKQGASVWGEVEAQIERGCASGQEKAAALLRDLRIFAEESGTLPDFARRLADIRVRHARRKPLIEQLRGIG